MMGNRAEMLVKDKCHRLLTFALAAKQLNLDHQEIQDLKDHPESLGNQEIHHKAMVEAHQDHQDHPDHQEVMGNQEVQDNPAVQDKFRMVQDKPVRQDHQDHPDNQEMMDNQEVQETVRQDHPDHQEMPVVQEDRDNPEVLAHRARPEVPAPVDRASIVHHHEPHLGYF